MLNPKSFFSKESIKRKTYISKLNMFYTPTPIYKTCFYNASKNLVLLRIFSGNKTQA